MRLKRFCITSVCFILIIISFAVQVNAHSGRTDANGGHHVSATGGYHYHCGGNPAHQHENGICPYDKTQDDDSENIQMWIFLIIVGCIIVLFVINSIVEKICERVNNRQANTESALQTTIYNKQLEINNYIKQNENLQNRIYDLESELSKSLSENEKLKKESPFIIVQERYTAQEDNHATGTENLNLQTFNQSCESTTDLLGPFVFSELQTENFYKSIEANALSRIDNSDLSIEKITLKLPHKIPEESNQIPLQHGVSFEVLIHSQHKNETKEYITSLSSCTCEDFKFSSKIPCKHMVFLAQRIGALYLYKDHASQLLDEKITTLKKLAKENKALQNQLKKMQNEPNKNKRRPKPPKKIE